MTLNLPKLPQNVFRALLIILFALAGLSYAPDIVSAQSGGGTGRIEGTILDSSSAVVPEAEVTVRSSDTGISAAVRSDKDGHFIVLYLTPGSYSISIKKDGFQTAELRNVTVSVGTTSSIQLRLALGSVSITRECQHGCLVR